MSSTGKDKASKSVDSLTSNKSGSSKSSSVAADAGGNTDSRQRGIDFILPHGIILDVQSPAVPLLSSGYTAYPMNKAVCTIWEQKLTDGEEESILKSMESQGPADENTRAQPAKDGSKLKIARGRLAVLGSLDVFSDDWLNKEENLKLQQVRTSSLCI